MYKPRDHHRIQRAVLCCAVLLQAAFGGSRLHAQSRTDVAVRIENACDKAFDRVVVTFPEQQENYGRIPAASMSPYRTVTKAYDHAYLEVALGDEVAVIMPVDNFGATLLPAGRYTYRLTLNTNSRSRYDRVRLEFVIDK
jgi:hypothetical protein